MIAKVGVMNNRGFTIVELMVVVIVTAILAAITTVSYNGMTNRARAASKKERPGFMENKINSP